VVEFAEALPAIRAKVREHMALRGLPREKVVATIVHLLETTLIRVGNDDYARQNNSYGLTTLKTRHVAVNGHEVRFRFIGKSGKQWSLRVRDRRIAKIIRACQDLPGQELLQYLDDEGQPQDVTSSDVNAYLKEITGKNITAKDFRAWAGTVLAAMALNELKSFDGAAQAKRNLRTAIENVASRLGNTATICRKCYVHPEVLTSYLDGNLVLEIKSAVESELRADLAASNRRRPLFWQCCVGGWRESSREMRRQVLHPRPQRLSTPPRTKLVAALSLCFGRGLPRAFVPTSL
jgi:DNA topoisomerase I